ncbi:hypothetical protein [Brevibacillus dissolubilis]|uniref:hypothetical protein n=1 Tax=Brevibacillus dissolubilis TaxID=1844116 RepID=UPI0011166EBC|nr:hypothetical protein [Brevibacillus dissolubilis]
MLHLKKFLASLVLLMACLSMVGFSMVKAAPVVEEGLYIGGATPVMFSMDELMDNQEIALELLSQVDYSQSHFILLGKMAVFQDILSYDDVEAAFGPIDTQKMSDRYTRYVDGSTVEIEKTTGEDGEAPEIEYIR